MDDDMYMDIGNLINALDNLGNRDYAMQSNFDGGLPYSYLRQSTIYKNKGSMRLVSGQDLLKKGVYMGGVSSSAPALRASYLPFPLRWSHEKWTVTLLDYPYDYFPPYHPGAAIVLSKNLVSKFYYASFFVKYFWIDDIYLGIIAKKLDILPLHNPHFLPGYPEGTFEVKVDQISEAISIHGSKCPEQMVELWNSRDPNNLVEPSY